MMGKLGVGVSRRGEESSVESMTEEQYVAALELALHVAEAVILDAKVIAVADLGRGDMVVTGDGRRFWLGDEFTPASDPVVADGIVDAQRRRGNAPAPEGARLDGPPFKASRDLLLPDGELDEPWAGEWGPYMVSDAIWMPWDSFQSRFEGREYPGREACARRCWFLNRLGLHIAPTPPE
jgi:hypothetical protein